MICCKRVCVAGEEVPVERRVRAGVWTDSQLRVEATRPARVTHLVDVRAAGGIGLGGHHAAVGEQGHPDHVGQHHPVGSIDEARPHPRAHRSRVDTGRERQVAEHHQPLDVMCVPVVMNVSDHVGDAGHLCVCLAGEHWRDRARGAERVACSVAGHPEPIDPPHVLAPADHLPDEALDRAQRSRPLSVRRLGGLHDLGWVQQTEVHRRCQRRVSELPLCGEHRVFMRSEQRQTVVDELVQTDQGLRSCDGPRPIGVGTEG